MPHRFYSIIEKVFSGGNKSSQSRSKKNDGSNYRRRLFAEALEDRRLLAVAADSAAMFELPPAAPNFGVFYLRSIQIDKESLIESLWTVDEDDRFQLPLFPEQNHWGLIQSRAIDINGTLSIAARLEGFDYAFGYLSISGDRLLVSVDIPESGEKYITRVDPISGQTFLLQLDTGRLDELIPDPPIIVDNQADVVERDRRPAESTGPNISPVPVDRGIDQNAIGNLSAPRRMGGMASTQAVTQIDVMVVYTPAARNWANSAEGSINNTIATVMTRSNTASINSNLGISFNLVYSGEVDYVESGSSTDLGRLRGQSDGFMDELHAIRDSVAADMVAILTSTQDTGGVAYLLNTQFGREDLAFSLTRVQQASWTDTFIHELGHNMGASHHKQQNVQSGPTNWVDWPENSWSAGWRWQGNNGLYYTSIMSYSAGQYYADGINSTRVSFFSNPSTLFQGQPTGHPVDGNNSKTLREIGPFIGQYRDTDTLQYCKAQGGNTNYGIRSVQIGAIDQASGTGTYYDFSFLHTDLQIGVPEQLTVNINNPFWNNQLLVWVDWNDDKDFLDAGELVFVSNQGAVAQYSVSILPPVGVQPGSKRMRIRLHTPNFGGNATPCGNNSNGEVQDFKLNVLPPEAEVTGSFIYHTGWNGSFESSIDSEKVLAKEGPEPETLTLANLLNNSAGITGLAIDIRQLAGMIDVTDLMFQWSPQGAFQESLHPPSGWAVAASPSSILVEPGQTSRLRIEWAPGVVMNRWLRVSVLATASTGLADAAVFYVGHLLGETTGSVGGFYTVNFEDIGEIRQAVGQTVTASNPFDIDKNGVVGLADIAAMRSSIGSQLSNITIGGSPTGSLPATTGVDDRSRIQQIDEESLRNPLADTLELIRRWQQTAFVYGMSDEDKDVLSRRFASTQLTEQQVSLDDQFLDLQFSIMK